MSEAPMNLEASVLSGIQEAMDTSSEAKSFVDGELQYPRYRQRHKKGENGRLSLLQTRYQRQIRESARNAELVDRMSRMVAWTWMPGRDRRECPPLVDLRDPRLLVMDRFPDSQDGPAMNIGLTMFRSTINKQGVVTYAAPSNVEMFKNFALRPHYRAGGLCLDSRNEEVFRQALALEQAMELVAKEKLEPVQTFQPPQCMFGFPLHFHPIPEWRAPMQDAVRRQLQPSAATLRCLLSPGGKIVDLVENYDGFRTINIEKDGSLIQLRIPNWTILPSTTRVGESVMEGFPLADLPREDFATIKDVTRKYPFKGLEWLERRIMDDLGEILTVEEDVWDHQTKTRMPSKTTWRCFPSQYVQNQMHRAVRFFLDFRYHLGRKTYGIDGTGEDIWTTDQHKARIDVAVFDARPAAESVVFLDGQENRPAWYADLLSIAPMPLAPWAVQCEHRGLSMAA